MDSELRFSQIPRVVHNELLAANGCQPMRQIQSGLSGATIWECTHSANVSACLRAWPTTHPTRERLDELHQQMRLLTEAVVNLTPRLYYSKCGSSITSDGQRLWELTTWLPGQANYTESPSPAKLANAMRALAQIHYVWCASSWNALGMASRIGSPTIADRLSRLAAWHQRLGEQTLIMAKGVDSFERQLIAETFELLKRWCSPLTRELTALAERRVAYHFVLRDIWSEHVLFTGDEVTGIIDFGASRYDEPTTDLVRLLGSLEPSNEDKRREGLDIYNHGRRTLESLTKQASGAFENLSWERFAIMEQTATVLSAAQWMEWLIVENKQFVRPREQLLKRWHHFVTSGRTK